MGRSAGDDRDVLALPLQRPRRHVSSGSTPSRVHPPSFDPDAARKAWRQVARVRGGGPGLGVDRNRRPAGPLLLGMLVAAGVVWGLWSLSGSSSDVPPPSEAAIAAASSQPANTAEQPPSKPSPSATPSAFAGLHDDASAPPAARPTSAIPMPASSIGSFKPATPSRMAPPATEDATQAAASAPRPKSAWRSAIPMPSTEPEAPRPTAPPTSGILPAQPAAPAAAPPLVQRGPAAPPGSPSAGVAALRKLPKGARDRPPLEGVGVSGIHIDRLDLGSSYDSGACQGSNRSYSADGIKTVHVCFRAVHRRQTERVLVKWSKNGRLVRRAWVVIPAAHAYRTRAGLRLRDSHVGAWSVTVESSDGVVLGRGDFKVTP